MSRFVLSDAPDITLRLNLASLQAEHNQSDIEKMFGPTYRHTPEVFHKKLTGTHINGTRDTYIAAVSKALHERAWPRVWQLFDRFILVRDFRQIRERGSEEPHAFLIDGQDVIANLFQMQHPDTGKEKDRKVFDRVERFVKDLLGLKELRMEIPHTRDKILLEMHGIRMPLESYGTGIHELIIMCSALAIHDNHTVCIEEPEIHLHPELQRKFLRFLQKTNNRYFITTHSNVFLDLGEPINVYHVTYDGTSSKVTKATSDEHSRHALADLGYKASDLLQANGIIWVEGPSDRVYIRKWLELLWGARPFVEGLHYSILFYGGSNLAHCSAASTGPKDDLIDLLRINSNAIVVIDRDGYSPRKELATRKKRILAELGEKSCWVTKGREVENYLRPELVAKVLAGQIGKPISLKFGRDDRLQGCIAAALRGKGGKRMVNYDADKVGYARKFVAAMEVADELAPLDLRIWIGRIAEHIRTWNGIES